MANEGRRSNDVVNEWLKLERKKQLALDDLRGEAKDIPKADPAGQKCNNCRLMNHYTKDCK